MSDTMRRAPHFSTGGERESHLEQLDLADDPVEQQTLEQDSGLLIDGNVDRISDPPRTR